MRVLAAFLANAIANFIIGLLVAKFLGPVEYGRFALAFAIAAVIQTAFFDWLRQSATRFYSERARENEPAIRATLDLSFILLALALAFGSALFIFFFGPSLALGDAVIALAIGIAIMNGLFDYSTALLRARFEDRLYGRLVLMKNILALALTGGGALFFHSAGVALAGSIASLFGAVISARARLADPLASRREACFERARSLIAYSAPIIAASMLYQSLPLASRALVAALYGFAETGQFSLAHDLGIRGVAALGSGLDVVLFQIAVAAHDQGGADKAKAQLARNMSIVIAFLMPACVGIWLTMPSIEALIVPIQYRGPFGHYLGLLLPGLFALGLIQFAVNPIFQIATKTAPLIAAAMVAVIAGSLLAAALPRSADASSLAIAQSGAYLAALCALLLLALLTARPEWPPLRDMLTPCLATAVMAFAVSSLGDMPPGFTTLAVEAAVGGAVYCALIFGFDTAGLRTLAVSYLRPILARA